MDPCDVRPSKRKNGIWYFRRSIPPHLRDFVNIGNKREFNYSLGVTKMTTDAWKLHNYHCERSQSILEEAEARWKAARNGGAKNCNGNGPKDVLKRRQLRDFSEKEIQLLVEKWLLEQKGNALTKYQTIFSHADAEERNKATSELKWRLARIEKREGFDNETPATKREILEAAGGILERLKRLSDLPVDLTFTNKVRDALVELITYSLEIVQTGKPPNLGAPASEAGFSTHHPAKPKNNSITLDQLIEKFDQRARKREVKPRTLDELALVYGMIRDFIGGETLISDITLVIAKLDRLARNLHFISGLMEAKIDFVAVDNPTTNRLTVQILAAVAEDEARAISSRTKAALASAKARGVQLGTHGAVLAKINHEKAAATADNLRPIISELAAQGIVSVRDIADTLNNRKIPTPKGKQWHSTSVLVNAASEVGILDETCKSGFLWKGVPSSLVRNAVELFQNHPECLLTYPEPLIEYISWLALQGTDTFDVLLKKVDHGRSDARITVAGREFATPVRTVHEISASRIAFSKRRVASKGDEQAGLTQEQIQEVKAGFGAGNVPDKEYRKVPGRSPLFMINFIAVQSSKDGEIEMIVPTYGISFPGDPGTSRVPRKTVQYRVNKVWWEKYIGALDEEEEDE